MSATESLRRDHNLIQKVLKALAVTAQMLIDGKKVPALILNQSIEFTRDFMLACHHSKEKVALFPTLERSGMAREGGPIARMIFEHGVSKELASKMETSARKYIQTDDSTELVGDIRNYIDHVALHIQKENLRLFAMADMILKDNSEETGTSLHSTEQAQLSGLGKERRHYEELASNLESAMPEN